MSKQIDISALKFPFITLLNSYGLVGYYVEDTGDSYHVALCLQTEILTTPLVP